MLKKIVILICLMSSVSALKAQTDSIANINEIDTFVNTVIDSIMTPHSSRSLYPKKKRKVMEIALETTLMQINSNIPFKRLGMNGSIELGYYPIRRLAFGLFYSAMKDIYPANGYYLIDDKVIDVASSELSNYGAYINYMIFEEKKFKIIPELQLGYGRYRVISANFDINGNKNTIEFNLMTIHPKARFVYDFSRTFGIGLSAGYLFPINYINRDNFKAYNIQNFNMGVYARIRL